MDLNTQTNLITLCRICMRDTEAVVAEDIYEHEPTDNVELNLHGMLGAICAPVFASMDIDEQKSRESYGMPKMACPDCINKIVTAYKLHVTCIDTDRKLWEMVMLKQELQADAEIDIVEQKVEPQDDVDALTNSKTGTLQDAAADNISTDDHINAEGTSDKQVTTLSSNKLRKSCLAPNSIKVGRCAICSKVIRSKKDLMIHMKRVHPNRIYNCSVCDDVFFTEAQYEEHKLFHKTGRRYGCRECGLRFTTRAGISNHSRIHTDSLLKCTKCDSSFTSSSALKLHFRTHTGEKPFACEQCPARFAQQSGLNCHNSTHNKEQNFVCAICGSRFTREYSLVTHNRIHTGERPFECDQCDKKFRGSHHLTRHKRTHTGEKPYKCAYCDRAFAQSNDLVKHSRSHVGDNPYKCDYCESTFRLLTELRNHFKSHFQPGDESEGNAMRALESRHPTRDSDTLKFTSTFLLNRRYKQEKQRDQQEKKKPRRSARTSKIANK